MKKEIINKSIVLYDNPYVAKEYVYSHRNIFNDKTTLYIEKYNPLVIKEISYYKDIKQYWYWVFYKNKIVIYQFDRKPNKKEYKEMINDIIKEYNNE